MLTGQLPFQANEKIAIALKHVTEPVPDPQEFNPDLPDELCRVLFKLLEKDPSKRYRSGEELMVYLEKSVLKRKKDVCKEEIKKSIQIKQKEELNKANPPFIPVWKRKGIWIGGIFSIFLLATGYFILTTTSEAESALNQEQKSIQNILERSLRKMEQMKGIQLEIDEQRQLGNSLEKTQQANVVLQGNQLFVMFARSEIAEHMEGSTCYRGKINDSEWLATKGCMSSIYRNYHPKELLLKSKPYIRKMLKKEQDDTYIIQMKLNEEDHFYPLIDKYWEMREVKPMMVEKCSLHINIEIDKSDLQVKEVDMNLNVKHKNKNWLSNWFGLSRFSSIQAKTYTKVVGIGSIRSSN
jgi:hypothetical protein